MHNVHNMHKDHRSNPKTNLLRSGLKCRMVRTRSIMSHRLCRKTQQPSNFSPPPVNLRNTKVQ